VPGAADAVVIPAKISVSLKSSATTASVEVGGGLKLNKGALTTGGLTVDAGGVLNVQDGSSIALQGGGLVSNGTVNMTGHVVTPWLSTQPAAQGATTITLNATPTGWKVGDQIVLSGTNSEEIEDEVLTIRGLSGSVVTVDPLAYVHAAAYVEDLARGISISGGYMQLSAGNLQYAGFYGMGIEQKAIPISATNPDDRYPVEFMGGSGTINGCVVDGSPGWGFINNGGDVQISDDATYNCYGAGFVAKAGNETGCFMGDLAIRDDGDDHAEADRMAIQDFGHTGNGYWIQGPLMEVTGCAAVESFTAGFYWWTKGLIVNGVTTTLPGGLAVGSGTLALVQNDSAFYCDTGFWIDYRKSTGPRDVFDSLTADFSKHDGYAFLYDYHITLSNSTAIGNLANPQSARDGVRGGIEAMDDLIFSNDSVSGWAAGCSLPTVGHTTITGGCWDGNVTDFLVRLCNSPLGEWNTINPSMFDATNTVTMSEQDWTDGQDAFNLLFSPQATTFNGVAYYFPDQAATAIPFTTGPAAGLTNQQLWNTWQIAFAGSLPGGGYDPTLPMVSPVTAPHGSYKLIWVNPKQKSAVVTIAVGWNIIVEDGCAFFVQGT
jgi:hypothetical protein